MTASRLEAREPSRRKALAADALSVAVIWLACLGFLWPLVTPDPASRLYFGRGDLTDQFYAFRRFVSQQLWAGDFPLWNPGMFAGHPALADIQSAVFYPVSLVTTLLTGPGGPTYHALQVEILAEFCLGGLFMYLLARRAPTGRASAVLAALCFCLGGYLTSYPPEQLPVLQSSVWLPLALVLADASVSASGRRRIALAAWCGAALGVSILAGHPQVAMLSSLLTLTYMVYRLWCGREWCWMVGAPVLAGLIALGASAVQWAPTLEFMGVSTRSAIAFDDAQAGFPLADLLSPLFPGFVGRASPLYVGLLPLVLAVGAAVWRGGLASAISDRGRDLRRFWSGAALVAFLLGFGGGTFLYVLPYLGLPAYGIFRGQERLALVYTVAAAMLAAMGLDLALRRPAAFSPLGGRERRRLVVWALLVSCATVALGIFGTANAEQPLRMVFSFLRDRAGQLLAALAGSLALLFAFQRGLDRRVFVAGALLLTTANLMWADWPANLTRGDPTDIYTAYPAIVHSMAALPPSSRVHSDRILPENFGAVDSVAAVQGNSPLRVRAMQDLEQTLDAWRFWLLMDVQMVVSANDPGPGARLVVQEADAAAYSLAGPKHAWVVGASIMAESDSAALALLAAPGTDVQTTAVVRDTALLGLSGQAGAAAVTVYRPQYVALDAAAEGRSLLVVSDVYYPGWRARVDGLEAPVYRVDHALRGVLLETGAHRVEFYFLPLSLLAGARVTAASLLALVILSLWARR